MRKSEIFIFLKMNPLFGFCHYSLFTCETSEDVKLLWDSRPRLKQEACSWLHVAVEAANLEAVRFLFECNLVSIADIPRSNLFYLTGVASEATGGLAMFDYLVKEQKLDLQEVVSDAGFTLRDTVLRRGSPRHVDFVETLLGAI
jgi:hypothetical protein